MNFRIQGKIADVQITGVNYALLGTGKDGNCLFHAAGHGLDVQNLLAPDQKSPAAFRQHVVAYIRANAKLNSAIGRKLREGLGVTGAPVFPLTPAQSLYVDQRLAYLAGAGNWGDEACITAIEQLYNVEALVYDDQGSLQTPAAIRYYTPSHSPAAKLRLCVRFVGDRPVHFELYVGDYDPVRDTPAVAPVAEGAINKGWGPPQLPGEPWAYYLNPKGMALFAPAIGQRQFAYSRAIIDDPSSSASKPKPVSVAQGDNRNSVVEPAPVVAVHLTNQAKGGGLDTTSFSAVTANDDLTKYHKEPFFLPLQRVDGESINLFDLSATLVNVDVDGTRRQPAGFYFRIYRRAHGRHGAGAENRGLLIEVELLLEKLKVEVADLAEPVRKRYTFGLGAVLTDKLGELLGWLQSPYQMVVSGDARFPSDNAAWTHFHVASEWDVNIAERFAGERVIMLEDSATALPTLNVKATAARLANTAIEGEPPNGRETFAPGAAQFRALEAVSNSLGVPVDYNARTYFLGEADGFYALTSWASMVYLRRNAKDRRYYAHSFYCTNNRNAWMVPADVLGRNNDDLAEVSQYLLDRYNRAERYEGDCRSERRTAKQCCQDAQAIVEEIRARASDRGAMGLRLRQFTYQCPRRLDAILSRKPIFEGGTFRDTVEPTRITELKKDLDALRRDVVNTAFGVTLKDVALTETLEALGVVDFQKVGGKPLTDPGITWRQYVFKDPVKITKAVTTGISSCAGGVTFSMEDIPEHVFMWHLDASLSIPLLLEMQRLWPDPKELPRFRTIALITPSPWELNKYRLDNLYPPEILDECQSVFMARGTHWTHELATVVAGGDLYGVDVSEPDQLDIVFTYDTDKRAPELSNWQGLAAESEDTPSVLSHFQDNLFGKLRYQDSKPADAGGMAEYVATTTSRVKANVDDIKRFKREQVNKSCRIPAVNAAVFKTINEVAVPLIQSNTIFALEKGDTELALRATPRWNPGSLLPKPKPKEEPKAKEASASPESGVVVGEK